MTVEPDSRQDRPFELRDQLRAVAPYWRSILAVVLVLLALAVVYDLRAKPVYESSMTFFAAAPTRADGNALQSDQFAQQRINSYVGVVTSDRLAARLVESTGVDLTTEEVTERLSATADPETVLLRVQVRDTSVANVRALSSGVASNLDDVVRALEPTSRNNNANQVNLTVISGPTLAPGPVAPRSALNAAVALLAGLFLGIGQAFVRSRLDTTFRSAARLADGTGASVLGVIHSDRRYQREPVLTADTSNTKRAEVIRQIRTNLRFMGADDPVRVIVVTSSVEAEAKSTTAANLAIGFARAERRTLLVDADLRRPRIARYLDLEDAVGLTSVLIGEADLEDVVQPWGTDGLDVVASGAVPPNPAELLGSAAMDKLLQQLRGAYEVVVIDTPPLVPVTDAAVVASRADGVIVNVRHGRTRAHQVSHALQSLRAVEARLLGLVMTFAPTTRDDRSAYYHDDAPAPTRRWWGRLRG